MKRVSIILAITISVIGCAWLLTQNQQPPQATSVMYEQSLKPDVLCHGSAATASFAALGSDSEFSKAHELPTAYKHLKDNGEMVSFPTADGQTGKAYFLKAKKKTDAYVFVIHEWWGLNDHIKREAERLYADLGNVNVMALDLYDGNVATTREEASKYMQAVKSERAVAIIQGAAGYSGEESRIATIGWCFGGGWSLQSAIALGDKMAACVMYYGMPEKETERLKALNTDVCGIFASHDGWIGPEVAKDFILNMKEAGKKVQVHIYDADHAFANPSSAAYQEEAAQSANAVALSYLKNRLQ